MPVGEGGELRAQLDLMHAKVRRLELSALRVPEMGAEETRDSSGADFPSSQLLIAQSLSLPLRSWD